MTTAVLDRVPMDRVTSQAREVRFGTTLLTVLAAVLYALGWLVAKVLGALWLALAWSATAVKVGWQEARTPRGEPAG